MKIDLKIKLGEILINHELLTPNQLVMAIKRQLFRGGRLGSNIIELGFLDIFTISKFLSEMWRIPFAHQDVIYDIKKYVLTIIPRNLIRQFRIIPISIVNRFLGKERLRLAIMDTLRLSEIEKIKEIREFSIEPLILPEIVIAFGLRKYYGITTIN